MGKLEWQCWLAGNFKTAPRILFFSICLGAEYLSYVKSIETHARSFLTLDILSIGTVVTLQKVINYLFAQTNFSNSESDLRNTKLCTYISVIQVRTDQGLVVKIRCPMSS